MHHFTHRHIKSSYPSAAGWAGDLFIGSGRERRQVFLKIHTYNSLPGDELPAPHDAGGPVHDEIALIRNVQGDILLMFGGSRAGFRILLCWNSPEIRCPEIN